MFIPSKKMAQDKIAQDKIHSPFMIGAIIAWALRGYKKPVHHKPSQKSNSFSGDMIMKKPLLLIASITAPIFASLFLANPALAHHPLDGATPSTLWHGIISGFAHPILGLDHLAFIMAVGLLALFQKNRLLLPASFVSASLLGCLLFLANIIIPFNEMLIAFSVICIGVALAYGRKLASHYVILLAIVAGLAHGTAYGEGIIGAEATPLIAYLTSFTVGQFLIALMIGYIAEKALAIRLANHIVARLSGAVTLGIGITFMAENIEVLAFGTI